MLETIIGKVLQFFTLEAWSNSDVIIRPGFIISVFVIILLIHYLLKIVIAYLSDKMFIVFLTYLFNSIMIVALSTYFVYVFDNTNIFKLGLQLLFIYGLCITLYAFIRIFKKDKKSV